MTTMTAQLLLDKIKDYPEILADMRRILNEAAGDPQTTPVPAKTRRPSNLERDQTIAKRVWEGASRRDIAHEYGISMPRVNQILMMYPNPNPAGNKNAARDAEIVKQVAAKVPRAEVAIKYGISLERVNQIARTVPKKKKRTLEERIADAHAKYASFDALSLAEEILILVTKYEPLARKIAQDFLNGMSQAQMEAKYPADITDGDIAWWGAHFSGAYQHFIDHETGQWIR